MFLENDNPRIDFPLSKKAVGRLKTLKRRAKWIERRLEKDTRLIDSPDRRELSALNWAIAYIKA